MARNRADESNAASRRGFQSIARNAIIQFNQPKEKVSNRIRHKLVRWRLTTPDGILVRRALKHFEIIGKHCRPCVVAMQWRTMWNGWPTSRRMRCMHGSEIEPCLLGCESGTDCIEHYAVCSVAWAYLGAAQPAGLGLQTRLRSISAFLGLERDLADGDRCAMAEAAYAVARTVQCCRLNPGSYPRPLLRLYAKSAHSKESRWS